MEARPVAPGLWRLPFASSTLPPFDHTNGWLIVSGEHAVLVDPGFRERAGLAMVDDAMAGSGATTLEAVCLTHAHRDHVEGLPEVCDRWPAARVRVHAREADRLDVARGIRPLEDGAEFAVADRSVRALHTPGHSPGHLAFHVLDIGWVLVGDLLAGRGSVWVGAPEGDLAAYLRSLDRVAAEAPVALAPGHGDPLHDPGKALLRAREHRLHREAQIVAALAGATEGVMIEGLRAVVYPDLDPQLAALAERSLQAHLEKLLAEGRVVRASEDPRGPYLSTD